MNEYYVFWIKEPFAYRYFEKADILFRFLQQYERSAHGQDLEQQFNYVTKAFSKHILLDCINNCDKRLDIHIKDHIVYIRKEETTIELHLFDRYLKFYCRSLHDAEEILFPILRSFNPFLFITGTHPPNFGWIAPFLTSNDFTKDQLLYSLT
ncbi:sporulation inhibitor of replication protein SirA [Virgibacillus sp. W0181]|uniref:sporulation inhibitor of replication protein SirA n=1 Tax=Virgibacillus sp. W0181 TaxID=3391581 RepID=UPI003F48A8B7